MTEKKHRKIPFSIDGERFTTKDPKQTASALLELAGLDPSQYDLGELCRPGETQRFADDDVVCIEPGSRFVSIRESAQVA